MKKGWALVLAAAFLGLAAVGLTADEKTDRQETDRTQVQVVEPVRVQARSGDRFASNLDRDRQLRVNQRQDARPVVPQPQAPAAGPEADPLRALLADAKIGRPHDSGDFRVFTVLLKRPQYDAKTLTLDQALLHKVLSIREKDGGTVPTLLVTNTGDARVFLMAGELVLGGKQDRIIRQDVVVPPHTEDMEIPVYCGQRGRWHVETPTFQTKGSAANASVRKTAVGQKSQGAVWGEIDKTFTKNARSSDSSKLQEVLEDREIQTKVDRVAADLLSKRDADGYGLIVTHRGRILGVDIFGSHALYDGLAEKVLASYVVEALAETDGGVKPVSRDSAQNFLAHLADSHIEEAQTVGMGQAYIIRAGDTEGGGLIVNGQSVHVAAIR